MGINPVLELMEQRFRERSRPGVRSDGARLGLAVEGGGMRGVVSAGMLMELAEQGYRPLFDAVYGVSAGAINAAYFVAGRPSPGLGLYQLINNDRFINPTRAVGLRPLLDLDYLAGHLASGPLALDYRAVLGSPVEFKALASCLETLEPLALGDFQSRAELVQGLIASCAIPILTRGPRRFRGRRFLDGSLFQSIPYPAALDGGCSHVLALLSRPLALTRRPDLTLKRRLAGACLETLRPGLGPAYLSGRRSCGPGLLELGRAAGPPHVLIVEPPPETAGMSQLEKSLGRLQAGADLGREALGACLQGGRV